MRHRRAKTALPANGAIGAMAVAIVADSVAVVEIAATAEDTVGAAEIAATVEDVPNTNSSLLRELKSSRLRRQTAAFFAVKSLARRTDCSRAQCRSRLAREDEIGNCRERSRIAGQRA